MIPEYQAPEVLLGMNHTKSADWYTLGELLYEMLTGLPPFHDEDEIVMRLKILNETLQFPDYETISPAAKDILTRLLDRNPQHRLGANGASEIKAHSFFHGINWKRLLQKQYEPLFKPILANADQGSSSDAPGPSSLQHSEHLRRILQQRFAGWSTSSSG
jgi:serum/glucocorticoid-regulated kinase 2